MKNKLQEKKLQYKEIADLRRSGINNREIAKKYNCTHQNISLKLKRYFPNEKFPEKRGRKAGFSKFGYFILKCKHCKKEIKLTKTKPNLMRQFCSMNCYILNSGRRININVNKMTKDQYRAYQRVRCNQWYHKNKNNPHFKELIRKYNKNAWLKRKERLVLDKSN